MAVDVVDPLEAVEVDEQQADRALRLPRLVHRAVEQQAEADAVEQSGERVMAGLERQLVDEPAVLDRRPGERGDPGQPVDQLKRLLKPLRTVDDRHRQHAEELVPVDDRRGHDPSRAGVADERMQLGVLGARVEEQRCTGGQRGPDGRRNGDIEHRVAMTAGMRRLVAPGIGRAELLLLLVPEPHRGPVAVDDPRQRLREPAGDLRRGPRLPEVVGEGQQRTHDLVAPGDIVQRH